MNELIDILARWLHHDSGCSANDLDPLDHSPCTCGLREYLDPWNRLNKPKTPQVQEYEPPNESWDYRDEQARLRAAGWDAYNSDYVDEFPRW